MADLVEESGYHRSHVLRIRQASIEPGRDAIAAIVSALRRLSLEDVRPDTVFELTREESGPWQKARAGVLARELAAYRRERERTEKVLAQLIAEPRGRWLAVARRAGAALFAPLARAAILDGQRLIDRSPQHAAARFALGATLADAAEDIEPDYRAFLAGRARLEHANARRQLGEYRATLPLLDEAEARFEGIPLCTHDLGRAWFLRGSVIFKMNGLAEALHHLRLAVNVFAALDDQRRLARVRFVQGNVLFEQQRTEDARALWLSILPVFEAGRDRHSLASLLLNLGWCDLERGMPDDARRWLHDALDRFTKLRSRIDLARTRWALALVDARHGDRAAGVASLRREHREFQHLGSLTEAGMVHLDVAEILLLDPRRNAAEAAQICKDLIPVFQRAGATKEVLKALAYLREAAQTRIATPELVRRIRLAVKRADSEAEYTFRVEDVQ